MVPEDGLAQVMQEFATLVTREFTAREVLGQLARSAARVLRVDGAGVMIDEGDDLLRYVFATGEPGGPLEVLEQLQELLQEGPCRDSRAAAQTLCIADLAEEGSWPTFRATATQHGIHGVTALPLLARGRAWGVLDLYRARPGLLAEQDLSAAQTLAHLATSYLVVADDRDRARDTQRQLAHLAMHDPLTGLPVRWVFLDRLRHALARLSRRPGHVGVLFCDIDGLKHVNDRFGHAAGDTLITTCVDRIRVGVRPTDVVARLGGDELVVLLEDIADADAAVSVARRVLRELGAPYLHEGQVVQPSVSIGVAATDRPGDSPAALIAHADAAMYRAKQSGPGCSVLFDASVHAADRDHRLREERMVAQLRTALDGGQLEVHYQPVFDVSAAEPALQAVEALVRWHHPERGLLEASEFVPAAERSGLITAVGSWVLGQACQQLATWSTELGDRAPGRVFVNLSVEELVAAGTATRVSAALTSAGLAPERLVLEITESRLARDPAALSRALDALRALGCALAVDDVGVGYSSLSRLVELPSAVLKLDGSFAARLLTHRAAAAAISAVLLLGRDLAREVVVEGVEDDATLHRLRELGVRLVQGHLLARPQSAADLSEVLLGV